MAISQHDVTVTCDFCGASYVTDRPVLKPEWQHVTVAGVKGLVACPRENVEQTIVELSPQEAQERFADSAKKIATREGIALNT